MKNKIILLILLVVLSSVGYAAHNPDFQEGFTYTSWWYNDYLQSTSDTSLDKLEQDGVDYVAVLVTWYMDDLTSTDIYQDGTKTPSDSAVIEAIDDIHDRGMKVMLKPHIDIKTYEWRGDINPSNWNTWFNNYEIFINHYADLAEANNVEQFVVGTELKSSTSRTSDWQSVISGIRTRYNESIVYAANWDNYDNVNFWNDLDYIGVNAYFPLTSKTDPTLTELKNAWADEKNALSSFSSSKGKQIIFTEIGYQSRDGTNIEPWWREGSSDEQEQADCYRAALEVFWEEDWLEGMYWWMWYWKYYEDPDDFAIYGKLAENVVEEFYCDEDWQVHYESCLTNDSRLKYYTDANNCGTTDDLPADNGTYVSCDYCSENIQGPFTTSCNISDEQTEYYVDNNYTSCCAVTGLDSDCNIDNGSYDNQTVSCDYCTPDWYEINESCQPDDTFTGWYNDSNGCYAITGLENDNNPPANNTYVCDYCTPNLVNTSWSDWYDVSSCRANDTILQERNRTEYDSNSCGEVNDTIYYEYQEVACDYCTPNMVNTSWSDWYDITGCRANDTILQERNKTEYDTNYCGEVENQTYFEQQEIMCDYCTPDWYEINESCQPDDTFTGWYNDTNNCYAQTGLSSDNNPPANNTYVCDYCTPNMVNTSWTDWENEGVCLINDSQKQNRSRVEYDENKCGEVSNTTHWDYQYIACDYCTPDWQAYNTSCADGNLTQYYEDNNNCYGQTGLSSDLDGKPVNQTLACGNTDCVVPYGGMTINTDTVFCRGDYDLGEYINITGSNVELDCNESNFNRLNTTYTGIYAKEVHDVTVRNCNFNGFSMAISFSNTTNLLIEDVDATGKISVGQSSDVELYNNSVYSIRVGTTTNLIASGNELTGNDHLIYLNRVYYSTITDNELTGYFTWARGISLDGVFNTTFEGNTIRDGGSAFYCWWNCRGNTIKDNTIANNNVGIVESWFTETKIYGNEFTENNVDASYVSSINNNIYDYNGEGNHWSRYDEGVEGCLDIDYNGICDSPYVLNNSNQDNYPVALPCTEDWQLQPSSCETNDQQIKYYIDANACGTTDNLPTDNGTYIACDYCTPDWQPYNTTCSNGNLTQYYQDDNNCYGQTGLSSDLDGKPANQTIDCGNGECNLDLDCGEDGYIGGKYCDGDNIMEVYRTYSCLDPGESNSSCSYSDQEFFRDTCEDGCIDGNCIVPNGKCIVPYDEMNITEDTVFCQGNYNLPHGINIVNDNVLLDCNRSSIVGSNLGDGITVEGYSNIEIKNCDISGFNYGVYAKDVVNVNIHDNDMTDTLRFEGQDSIIKDNKIVWAQLFAKGDNITISGNYVYGNDHLIRLYRLYNSLVVDNIIPNFASWGRGISMDGVYNTVIENNTIENGGSAIYCWYQCNDLIVRGNNLTDNTAGIGGDNSLNYINLLVYRNVFDNIFELGPVPGSTQFSYNQEGNRWLDYDEESEGCFDVDVDGICDDAYEIDIGFVDEYPLSEPLVCYSSSDCWENNGWTGDEYCSDGDVYQDYRRYKCFNPGTYDSYCSYIDFPKLKDECENSCSDGICLSEDCACSSDDDCGSDSYIGSSYCDGEDVYRIYRKWDCHNQGTNEAYCSYDDDSRLMESCSSCVNGACVDSCSIDSDCGEDIWIGSPYCISNDVWQNFGSWNCNLGNCEYSESDELKESCDLCSNGVCVDDYGKSDKQADISVSGLVLQYPNNPKAGETTIFAFALRNTGEINVEAEWILDTGEELVRGFNALKAGEARIIARQTEYSAAGSYDVRVIADPNGDIDESDESNNKKEIVVEVN